MFIRSERFFRDKELSRKRLIFNSAMSALGKRMCSTRDIICWSTRSNSISIGHPTHTHMHTPSHTDGTTIITTTRFWIRELGECLFLFLAIATTCKRCALVIVVHVRILLCTVFYTKDFQRRMCKHTIYLYMRVVCEWRLSLLRMYLCSAFHVRCVSWWGETNSSKKK